ncbi:MAG: molybdopterin-guanine dinucleotide biosynthesis protein MobA [Acidimicrobiia bacterium]|nr:molybdopterin-guanine dinucleotide biosynthesis protein MobA [Acidimicrobiia bacterium]MBV8984094.1 molybdopterin-guanine dinucleotide biosynthesis protein MobA [Acidimicrobiia bacterium]MBV9040991.1 molybdopterin-guanine dinucleotide biosynthesis protein MobA [Acidimicrobiia bacterium]
MDDWLSRYSTALGLDLSDDEVDAILDLARDVAHGTERRFAPLSAYLAGKYVTGRVADGLTAGEAVREAQEVVGRLLAQ